MMVNKRVTAYLGTGAFILVAVIILLGAVFIRQAQASLYDEKVNYLDEISTQSAENIRIQINEYLSTVDAVATLIGAHQDFDVERSITILRHEAEKNLFKRMGIILPDGTAVTTDGYQYNFSERIYFKEAMAGKLSVSDCLIDKVNGGEINVFAAPINHRGEIIGVVFATKSQEEFSEIMKIQSFGGKGYSYIITSCGIPVVKTTHPSSVGLYENLFEEMNGRGISDETRRELEANIENGKDGLFEYFRDGQNWQVCYKKIGVNDWYILSEVPSAVISMHSNRLILQLIILTILIIIIAGTVSAFIIVEFQRNKKKLEELAFTDKITGYSNSTKFSIDAKNILESNKEQAFAMVIFDVNKFKVINDLFGHRKGNIVLSMIADIVAKSMGSLETFSRISSDNFSILMKYENDEAIIERLNEILHSLENLLENYKIGITAGVYRIIEPNVGIDVINDRANVARNMAKKQNDTFYYFFREENRLEILREKEIENVMEIALENHEFQVYLQPKYLLKTNEIMGAEALVRWNRKELGFVLPNDFIPLFEKNGFIRNLDLYMFEQVCALIAKWKAGASAVIPISVNISRAHLSDKILPQKLLSIANKYGVDPKLLEIELTESAVYLDADNMIDLMHKIKQAGFLISIDDFGSGYSSLGTLKDIPANFIKIDKSFLDKAVSDKRGEEIINSIIAMTKVLGLSTVAEGVELEQQRNFLREAGCTIAQGYFYAKPMPVFEFEEFINRGKNAGR